MGSMIGSDVGGGPERVQCGGRHRIQWDRAGGVGSDPIGPPFNGKINGGGGSFHTGDVNDRLLSGAGVGSPLGRELSGTGDGRHGRGWVSGSACLARTDEFLFLNEVGFHKIYDAGNRRGFAGAAVSDPSPDWSQGPRTHQRG